MKTTLTAAAAVVVTTILATSSGHALSQAPPDAPYPGSKMTRQQIMDKLTSAAPGTTSSTAKGKELYDKLCAGCHIFGDTGISVGPDLTTLASRFGKRETLDSILWPSRTISDQYAVTVFELADGSLQSGVVVREDARAVYIKNAENLERPRPILLSTIKERTESTVSLMPEHLVAELTLDDIESLVAYARSGS
jgi:putative heme-binding domain-containing protein